MTRINIREIIVVEGLHDKQAVERVADADIWVLGGDRIARHLISELQRAARKRGVIIFTDPDGPGERIRRRMEPHLPGCKHAFVPKALATSDRAVGVEHASDEAILQALEHARPTVLTAADLNVPGMNTALNNAAGNGTGDTTVPFTLLDLIEAGLIHHPEAAARRQRVGEVLGIGYGNAKAFLRKLNVLGVDRVEFEQALKQLEIWQPSEGRPGSSVNLNDAADSNAESADRPDKEGAERE